MTSGASSTAAGCGAPHDDWRGGVRRGIGWTLAAKLAALALLWALFFSGTHRVHVTPALVAAQMSLHTQARATVNAPMEATHD